VLRHRVWVVYSWLMQGTLRARRRGTGAQAYWDRQDSYLAREDASRQNTTAVHVPVIHRAGCTWDTCAIHPSATCWRVSCACAASMCCSRWVGTPFGLPAENAAIANGEPPAAWTREKHRLYAPAVALARLCHDWKRELATCDPSYYRWNQWLFLRMLRARHRLQEDRPGQLGSDDKTVLANEQVIDGRGWRTGALVEKREIRCITCGITAYAEELLSALNELPGWPERVRVMQAHWIGRSEGVELAFPYDGDTRELIGADGALKVFTTRADTLFGVTFVAVSAEHPLAAAAATRSAQLAAFVDECRRGSTMEADVATAPKRACRPACMCAPVQRPGDRVWVANYVLMAYGEGAVMGVPAHDERDFEFARSHDIPIRTV